MHSLYMEQWIQTTDSLQFMILKKQLKQLWLLLVFALEVWTLKLFVLLLISNVQIIYKTIFIE
jgi:hypothetical protein